jgi:hypothetical protein
MFLEQRPPILHIIQRIPDAVIGKQFFSSPKRRKVLDLVPVLLEQFLEMGSQTIDLFLPDSFGIGDEVRSILERLNISSSIHRNEGRSQAHLLPNILLLCQSLQRLVQRFCNNLSNRYIPRPRLVNFRLFQKINERLCRFDWVMETARRDNGFRTEDCQRVIN